MHTEEQCPAAMIVMRDYEENTVAFDPALKVYDAVVGRRTTVLKRRIPTNGLISMALLTETRKKRRPCIRAL